MTDHALAQGSVRELADAVKSGDMAQVRVLLNARPELIGMDVSANDEHRAIHYAVLGRDPAMVRLLMEAGADARKGIFPHRDATSAYVLARDREYDEIVAVLEEEERLRREEMSCPNATVSPVQDRISAAIAQGDNEAAIALLEADGSLIQACDRNGATPLHIAAEEANEAMVEWLLVRRAHVDKQDGDGMTPLDRAALAADPRNDMAESFPGVAKLLLQRGATLTIRGAVALADVPRVHELIGESPELLGQMRRNGGLVTLAVNHGNLEVVKLLLDLGADVDERVTLEELELPTLSWGMPLWCAALAGQREIAELLLDGGADPNANVYASGWPLRNAWDHRDDSVKRLLLARGAIPQPYMIAEAHDVEGARRLLESDNSEELRKELTWSAANHGCAAIAELALARLPWAREDPRWHWILIQPIRGATGNEREDEGFFVCMDLLLRRVDANVARLGQTALHYTAARHPGLSDTQRARFAGMLLDAGASFRLRDELLQSTPLGWACRWGREEMARLLIARGAPVDETDAEAWATPRAWARKMGWAGVVALLDGVGERS